MPPMLEVVAWLSSTARTEDDVSAPDDAHAAEDNPGAVIAFRRRSKRTEARDENLASFAGYGRYWDEHLARHHGDWKSAIGEIVFALDRRGALSHGKSTS